MQAFLAVTSNYLITIFIAIYSFITLLSLRPRYYNSVIIFCIQSIIMNLFTILCSYVCWYRSGDLLYIYLGLFMVFIFTVIGLIMDLAYPDIDKTFLANTLMLLSIGMIILGRISVNKAKRQFIIILITFICCLLVPLFFNKIRIWRNLKILYGILGVSSLALVFLFGALTNGSKFSITVYNVTFQPSEFGKILLIFFIAASLWNDVSFKNCIITASVVGLEIAILAISKDLGSGIIYFVCFLLLLFIMSERYLYLLLGIFTVGGCSIISYFLFSHIHVRVLAWLYPFEHIEAEGYQIAQSLFAISGGGLFGTGLMRGAPKSIPYVEDDMIFSAICEEFGIIFGFCVLLICISCFISMIQIATLVHDRFYQSIILGVAIIYAFQIFMTVGGGTKLIPLTGVTLPFLSYGGSSVMTTMLMFFIVQGINIRLFKKGVEADGEARN